MDSFTNAAELFVGCPYCSQLFRHDHSVAAWDRRVLPDEADVTIVPTRGMLAAGWLLVIPQEHVLSIRQLDKQRLNAVWQRVAAACDVLRPVFGEATVFEHGAATARSVVGCGVDHAHLHAVPLEFDLLNSARKHPMGRALTWRLLRDKSRWFTTQPNESYLFLDSPVAGTWTASGGIPSQFFRRVIADELGKTETFDWRSDDGLAQIELTQARLASPTFAGV
jgi:diadenosine tetraphosphate (Ap4A) HIT family hydrolase